jgi:oligopeptide transport system substrate-binding protein
MSKIGAAAGAMAIATALVLTGCSTGGETPEADGDATAIISVNGSEPQNPLVPANTNETGGGKIIDNLFAGLVYYDAEGAPVNDLAESIETTDSQNYTIKIKSGETFTNGEEITAKSFVDAWQWAALLSNAALNSYFFEDIQGFSYEEDSVLTGLEVVDDTTFTVALNDKRSDFPLRLGYSAFYPLPSVAYDDLAAFGENPIGNGPYKLASEGAWEHNVKIELVTNEDYNGGRKPVNGGLSIVFYATQDAAYAALRGGDLDILDAIPESALASYQDDLGDRAINVPSAIFQSITIPSNLDNFTDKTPYEHFQGEEGVLRRQAISHAIDRDTITDVIFDGTRTPAHDFTSPVIDGYSESVPGSDVLEYDEALAQDLWAQADAISPWEGTFTISYNADGGHASWVDAVANSIKNVLSIDAEGAPYPTFAEVRTLISKNAEGKRDIANTALRTGWQADYPGLFNFLGPIYAANAGSNDGDYSNPEFDALLDQGSAAETIEEANGFYQDAQAILFQDLPAIPLWYSTVQAGYGENVENVAIDWHSVPLYYQVTKAAE